MTRVSFTMIGTPIGKGRPRFGRGHTYTPQKTVDAEQDVAFTAGIAFSEPFTGPVRVSIVAVFKPAPSWSKAKVKAHLGTPHTQNPDIDNIEKLILDGMNGVAYRDDSQVAATDVRKVWGIEAKTEVTVEPLTHEGAVH